MGTDVHNAPSAEDDRARARRALEQVCARGDFDAAATLYDAGFVDHVNDLDFHGQDGIRQSVGLYRSVLSNLRIRVEDQVAEGDRVVSRWTAEGTNRGRAVSLKGITISRLEDGRIVEDWTVSDNLSLLRGLGPWRTVLVGLGQLTQRLKRRP
jgi:predicted ester cyclase